MGNLTRAFVGIVVAALLVAATQGPAAWTASLAAPQRQTVPLTPPPTWTPEAPTATATQRSAPPAPPPTATSAPDQATPEPRPRPWLWLEATPDVIGPGSQVMLRVELVNVGDAPLAEAALTLSQTPLVLRELRWEPAGDDVRLEADKLVWRPRSLEAQQRAVLLISGVVPGSARPGGQVVVRAELAWPEGAPASGEVSLSLPRALLPETGR